MKKIIFTILILFIGYPISAQELQDNTTKTGKPVTLQRKIPKDQEQPPEIEDESIKSEEKTKNPTEQNKLTPKTDKIKSNKPKYSGLTIYDKPEEESCNNCYYYAEYKYKDGKYRKNTYYDRKALTKKEKAEKMEKLMKRGGGGGLGILTPKNKHTGKMRKICK